MSGTNCDAGDVLRQHHRSIHRSLRVRAEGFGEGNCQPACVHHPSAAKLHYQFLTYCLSRSVRTGPIFCQFHRSIRARAWTSATSADSQSHCSPLPEQQRIAAYLDASCAAIDAAVAAKRRQLETLDALRRAMIHNAVTKGCSARR